MFPRLLRLLLCLCLLVDAVAPAVAATHVALATAGAEQVGAVGPADEARAGMADCHATRDAPAPDEAPPTPQGDCLQRCIDLCLQQAVALPPPAAPVPACAPARAQVAPARTQVAAGHTFPPLRPPIA